MIRYFTFSLFLILNINSNAKTRPTSTINSGVDGLNCSSCQIVDPNQAFDSDQNSYCLFETKTALLGGYGHVTYEFSGIISSESLITVQMSIEGSSILNNTLENQIFNYVTINLIDNSNNVVATFNSNSNSSVELIDNSSNRFAIKIINKFINVKSIEIKAGSLVSLLNENLRIYDVFTENRNYNFVDQAINSGSGFSGGLISLCLGCMINNADYATETYDPNNQKAELTIPLGASILSNDYLYVDYDWSGQTFDGTTHDLYMIAEKPDFANVSTDLFDDNQLELVLQYDDNTSEVISNTSGLVTADLLYEGGGRFYIHAELQNGKNLEKVQVRLYQPSISASIDNNLFIYTIFTSTNNSINPLDLVKIFFSHKKIHEYETKLIIEHNLPLNEFEMTIYSGIDTTNMDILFQEQNVSFNQFIFTDNIESKESLNYYMVKFRSNNTIYRKTQVVELKHNLTEFYPNPSSDYVKIRTDRLEYQIIIQDLKGKVILQAFNKKFIDVSMLESGIYFFTLSSNNTKILKTEKFIKM